MSATTTHPCGDRGDLCHAYGGSLYLGSHVHCAGCGDEMDAERSGPDPVDYDVRDGHRRDGSTYCAGCVLVYDELMRQHGDPVVAWDLLDLRLTRRAQESLHAGP